MQDDPELHGIRSTSGRHTQDSRDVQKYGDCVRCLYLSLEKAPSTSRVVADCVVFEGHSAEL